MIRTEPELARQLVLSFDPFRKNFSKRPSDEACLSDEIEHVNAYLQIELARFPGRLAVEIDMPDDLGPTRLPTFSLQPIVENAIKHGTSRLIGDGKVQIRTRSESGDLLLSVEDNAGLYEKRPGGRRLGNEFGRPADQKSLWRSVRPGCCLRTQCLTRVTLRLPLEGGPR